MGWDTVLGLNAMQAINQVCAKAIGVTLRDVFAMAALNGLLCEGQCTEMELSDLAAEAYALADGMLEARKQSLKKGD